MLLINIFHIIQVNWMAQGLFFRCVFILIFLKVNYGTWEHHKNESKNITGRRDPPLTSYAENSFSDHCILAMDARYACNRDTIAFAVDLRRSVRVRLSKHLSKRTHHLLTFPLSASESVCCCVDATKIIEDKRLRWGAVILLLKSTKTPFVALLHWPEGD